MLRVLIVDDSPVARDLIKAILEGEPDIEVVGTACDGAEGVELVARLEPDIVSMDVQMPRMDGFAATREIMASRPTPIVVVSGSMESPDVEKSMESLRAGALTVIGKPGSPSSPRFEKAARTLVETLRTMSEVEVVRKRFETAKQSADPPAVRDDVRQPRIVAIAASTGGPQALHQMLSVLPGDFPVPMLLVQHISQGFLAGFISWLDDTVPLRVVEAGPEQVLEPATVYVAPEDRHLRLRSRWQISLSDGPPLGGFRPAATAMFESVAENYGSETIACILTGMGRDGVDGLKAVRRCGGLVLAQDEETSVVYGMPAAAVEAGLADRSETPQGIAGVLMEFVKPTTQSGA